MISSELKHHFLFLPIIFNHLKLHLSLWRKDFCKFRSRCCKSESETCFQQNFSLQVFFYQLFQLWENMLFVLPQSSLNTRPSKTHSTDPIELVSILLTYWNKEIINQKQSRPNLFISWGETVIYCSSFPLNLTWSAQVSLQTWR